MRIDDVFSLENQQTPPPKFGQTPVISFIKMMGYGLTFDDELLEYGLCDGITNMWVNAAICGDITEAEFLQRLTDLHKIFYNFTHSEQLRTLLKNEPLDLTNKTHLNICKNEMNNMLDELRLRMIQVNDITQLSSAEKRLLELRILGDGIMVMQYPGKAIEVNSSQKFKNLVRPYVGSIELEKKHGAVELAYDSKTYSSVNQIENYLNCLGDFISSSAQNPNEIVFTIGLTASPGGHAIGIRKEGENWILFDPSMMPPELLSPNQLGAAIKKILETYPDRFSLDRIPLFIRITTTAQNLEHNNTLAQTITELAKIRINDWTKAPLHTAIYQGSLALVNHLLSTGDYLSKKDTEGLTPIHVAARIGNLDILNKLISVGANLQERDAHQQTAAHQAVTTNAAVIELLHRANADLNVADDKGRTPLHLAIETGNIDTISALIQAGVNINAVDHEGRSVLHYAVLFDNEEALELIIKMGLDVNITDSSGKTLLHYAAQTGNERIFQALIEMNADLSAKDKEGQTPLHIAVTNCNEDIIKMLIDAKADINAADRNGLTPSHYAAKEDNIKALTLFIEARADLTKTDKQGNSAFYCSVGDETIMLLMLAMNKNALNEADKNIIDYLKEETEKCENLTKAFWDYFENIDEDKKLSTLKNLLNRNSILGSFFSNEDVKKLRSLMGDPQLKKSTDEVETLRPTSKI